MDSPRIWTAQMDTPIGVMTGLIDEYGYICELGFGESNNISSLERPPKEVATTRLYLGRQLFDFLYQSPNFLLIDASLWLKRQIKIS